jgi:hypothetical protein
MEKRADEFLQVLHCFDTDSSLEAETEEDDYPFSFDDDLSFLDDYYRYLYGEEAV